MKRLLALSIVLLSAITTFAQKPDFIRTPNGPNTIVDWNLKARTFILPHGSTLGLFGSQDTTGNVRFVVAPGDTTFNLRVAGLKWWNPVANFYTKAQSDARYAPIGGAGTTTYSLTNGYGLSTFTFNGSGAVAPKIDTTLIQTVANFATKGNTYYYGKTVSDGRYALISGGNNLIGNQTISSGGSDGLYFGYGSTGSGYGALWNKNISSKTLVNAGLVLYDGLTTVSSGSGGTVGIDINGNQKFAVDNTSTYVANTLNLLSLGTGTTSDEPLVSSAGVVKKLAAGSYKVPTNRYILATGQSNSNGQNTDAGVAGTDTTSNSKVLAFNGSSWVVAKVGVSPFSCVYPFVINPSYTKAIGASFFFAKKLQEATGDTVRIYQLAWNGQAIAKWTATGKTSVYWATIDSVISHSIGSNKIEAMLWQQGESDYLLSSTYAASFNSLLNQFHTSSWANKNSPIVIGAMVNTDLRKNIMAVQKAIAQNDSTTVRYAMMDDIAQNSTTNTTIHWTAKSQQILGRRMYDEFVNSKRYWLPVVANGVVGNQYLYGGTRAKDTLRIGASSANADYLQLDSIGMRYGQLSTTLNSRSDKFRISAPQRATMFLESTAAQSSSNGGQLALGQNNSSIMTSGNKIGQIQWLGYTGTTYAEGGLLSVLAESNWNNGTNSFPSFMQFNINTGSGTTIGLEAMRINSSKHLLVGGTVDSGNGEVIQATGKILSTGIDVYASDLTASYTSRTKIDKGYADVRYGQLLNNNTWSSAQTFDGSLNVNNVVTYKGASTSSVETNTNLITTGNYTQQWQPKTGVIALTSNITDSLNATTRFPKIVGTPYAQTGKTNVGTLLSYSVPSDGVYRATSTMFISAISTNTIRLKYDFTQVSGQVQSAPLATISAVTATSVLQGQGASGLFYLKGGTTFTISTENVASGGSQTYDVTAYLEKMP